ncbi:hypothetical protein PMAN_b0253 [Pseudoalteromonas marina]|jgi:hypothetical protein|uniref:hypothetical protein n=1 Tax=Pseudoalteromonas marina TaxID=267375 RepID=UPI0002318913|nr:MULTISPECIES: hypothetical protein [Pseudoalteromonas]KAF7772666.1 hypothetical protein PMAN_b0253 [Pseudoalteromonas marina]GAA75582.1 hypothetical protein P20480_2050 [Pseudoalteromonas sp. BSi20480]|tara:strand:+ start:880 stop:1392 length:513 start_codon:yes stop_codon:yes gene_type:complete
MNKYIAPPLGLIDHNNLKDNEGKLLTINYEMFPDENTMLFKKEAYLIVSTDYYSKIKKVRRFTQSELPLRSLPWIVDQIENGFFKRKDEGGFSNFKRSTTAEFEGETIGVNAMMHCCAENVPGLNIWNSNRKDYIASITPQEWDIPLYMLKDGLLAELKAIAKKYENGTL